MDVHLHTDTRTDIGGWSLAKRCRQERAAYWFMQAANGGHAGTGSAVSLPSYKYVVPGTYFVADGGTRGPVPGRNDALEGL
eukprot:1670275-Rhodomonas_salina.3